MGSNNNNDYNNGNYSGNAKAPKVEVETEQKKVSLFDWQRVGEHHTTATAHHYLPSCIPLAPPISGDNNGKYDECNPCACFPSTFLASGNSLQICSRCLSPILGHRRKSKMCELCMAKMTYGITNEFSERKLKHRRAALLMDKTACSQSNQWPSVSMSSGLQDPVCQCASSPEDRCAVYHHNHHHHHFHQSIFRLSAPLPFDVASARLCPPPNVFPFGDGVAGLKTKEDEDEVTTSSVLPPLHMHGNSIWRPFDSC
ncbi:hypothetical protein TcWFU_002518 [Taenia crassiceps]|uniref:Uncharacterized protein n=1 Tax=Taenia crassiceps TaxID=6207 RepID=A0ABR4Q4N5_9CEST